MPQSALTYALSHTTQNIPAELLRLAFKPTENNTTIEQRIINEIIEGPILLDLNLLGGKRREIFVNAAWKMPVDQEGTFGIAGSGAQGGYYRIPPEAREGRNIASVIGITSNYGNTSQVGGFSPNGQGGFGNTISGMASQMLNTRTMAQYPTMPDVTHEGTNIIRVYPDLLYNEMVITVMLEYDSEFLNMEASAIRALQNLCLCATKRYIANQLIISIDETEVVAGMEIGVIKTLVEKYAQDGEEYEVLLTKVKGAMHFDQRSLRRLIYHAI